VSSVVDFGILGPVQAVRDGREVELGGPRRRALLALLLVAGGRVVPAERLADELWAGCPPPAAAGTLRAHVSRLRTLLSPDVMLTARGAVMRWQWSLGCWTRPGLSGWPKRAGRR
jgi:DNA-binding SARP family transcriptional activator